MSFVGTAVAAASLVVGVGFAAAAGTNKGKPAKPVTLTCKITMAAPPRGGDNVVEQPPLAGTFYGPSHCRTTTRSLGEAVEAAPFKVADSGDTVGTYAQYFGAGSIRGKFDLTAGEGSLPTADNFLSTTYTGTLTVTGGTGIYAGIKGLSGKKHIGTVHCASPDTVHLTCTEKVKVTLPSGL
jgi:hypothetical protein